MFEELKSLDVPNSSIVKEQWYNIYTKDSQDQYQEIYHHLSEYPVIHNEEIFHHNSFKQKRIQDLIQEDLSVSFPKHDR